MRQPHLLDGDLIAGVIENGSALDVGGCRCGRAGQQREGERVTKMAKRAAMLINCLFSLA